MFNKENVPEKDSGNQTNLENIKFLSLSPSATVK